MGARAHGAMFLSPPRCKLGNLMYEVAQDYRQKHLNCTFMLKLNIKQVESTINEDVTRKFDKKT